MKNLKAILVIVIASLILYSCKKKDETKSSDTNNLYNFSMKIDGTDWKTTGAASWDINSSPVDSGFFLLTAGDDTEPEFGLSVLGTSMKLNTPINCIVGNFVPKIAFTHNNIDYDTENCTNNTNVGEIIFTSINAGSVVGTFRGKLCSSTGDSITLSQGSFNVPLHRF